MATRAYIIQKAEGTTCPGCKQTVDLLIREHPVKSAPAFYICWNCREVAEVGRGPVPREGQ